jgi:hypothetical protein
MNFKYTKEDVIEELGICKECGEYKKVVVDLRGGGFLMTSIRHVIDKLKDSKNDSF